MPTFTFPSTANQNGTFAVWTHASDRHTNVFYSDETIVQQFKQWGTFEPPQGSGAPARAVTGNWYLRDYYGTMIDSGSLTAATSWTHTPLTCGWYKLWLTQSGTDPTMGKACGSATICVVPRDSRFPDQIGVSPWPADFFVPAETRARAQLVCTMPRYVVQNSENSSGDLSSAESALNLDVLWYLKPSLADAARPRVVDFAFAQGATNGSYACDTTAGKAGVTSCVNTLASTYGIQNFVFEGPRNEAPAGGAAVATAMQTFYNTVKAANPAAKVIGYCPVTVGSANTQQISDFCAGVAAMNPVPLDGFSFHFYNNMNGDLTMGRKSMDGLTAILAANGLSHLPLYQTEQGFRTKEYGLAQYHMGGQWDMLMLLLFDQYGLPKEHCSIFYDKSTDESIPVEWQTQDQNLLPPAPLIGTFSREVWGKTFVSKLDFGTPGNDMMIGNTYHDPLLGTGMVALMGAGVLSSTIQFKVSGVTTIVQVDCWGNTSTLAVTAGKITVTVPLQPTYLRVPVGVSLTLVDKWTANTIAGNLSTGAVAASSGSGANQKNVARIGNGIHENVYFTDSPAQVAGINSSNNPYIDDTNSYPAWVTLTWPQPTRVDRVVIWCEPPWQSYGTLYDFDVQYWNGSSWVTEQTINQGLNYSTVDDPTANVFTFFEDNWQTGCTVHSYMPWRWIFDVPFTSIVSTTAVRVYVRKASIGQAPETNSDAAMIGDRSQFGNNFTIREVQTFCSDLAIERIVTI